MRGQTPLGYIALALAIASKNRIQGASSRLFSLASRLLPGSLDLRRHRDTNAIWSEVLSEALLTEAQARAWPGTEGYGSFLGFFVRQILETGLEPTGQLLQDVWALYESGTKTSGFFVEFGALDGVHLSNTLILERNFGWNGVLAEPNPRYHKALRMNRRAAIDTRAVWSRTGETISLLDCAELSTLKEYACCDSHAAARQASTASWDVETISLLDLLEAHHAPTMIDFMSIDTEGSEWEILAPFDFSKYSIRCICVEHNGTSSRERISGLLADHGYTRRLEGISRWDDWYVAKPGG